MKKQQKNWYSKVKNRLHLDEKCNKAKAEKVVQPANVSEHKFFPFIHFQIKQFKLSKKLEQRENELSVMDPYKKRDIYYAGHLDSYIYSYYNEKLLEYYERFLQNNYLECSIAYRHIDKNNVGTGKSNIDFAAEAFKEIKNRKECYAIGLDIHSFFDELDHKILYKNLCKLTEKDKLPDDLYQIYKILTKFHFIELDELLNNKYIKANEDRYIAWIDYCKNNLIPLLNDYCNSNCNLLDCQDFIWFVFNQNKGDNMSLKEKFIKYVYDIVYKSNQSYLQYGKKIENLDNVILNLTNKQIYEIQTSEELSSFLFQLKKISEWQDYNHKNGNGIPYAILNTHYRKFIQNNIVKDNSMKQEANFAQEKIYQPLNQILYGPPGTGKTYNTVLKAMSIIDNTEYKDVSDEQYSALKTKFDELKQAGQIEFVTFHQSYSYEEFVEGIKPYIPEWGTTDNTEVRYIGENGICKRICKKAESPIIKSNDNNLELNDNPKIWKVSLMKTGENDIRKDCMENNRIRIGFDKYGETINDETIFDDGGSRVLSAFIDKMEIGDIVLSCYSEKTIDAIGVVTSEYKWNNDFPQYKRYREVKWLAKGLNHNILEINNGTKFTLGTVYQLNNMSLKDVLDIVDEQEQVTSYKDNDKPYILIIDEINRGDVSKIFGELITLIEEDKRVGNKYQMKITLPYSKEPFGIPNNLYIIGTMNTADRSIALLDTALKINYI